MKRRCTFELQFCELSGIPTSFDAIRLVVDHKDGKRRYAATDVIKPSFGTASVPILGFQCGIYPTKTVQLRLMGGTNPESEGRRTPRLLARKDSLNWQLLATAPLPLGQLAPNTASDQDLGDASTFASSSATPVSTRGSSMDQATMSQLPGMGGSSATGSSAFATAGSSTAAVTSTPEGGRTATSPFRVMSGADEDDDAGSDSGQLFSTDSLAAAAASLVAHQQKQQQDEQRENSTVSLCGRSPGKGRRSSGEEPATGVGASQVAGLWVAGDSQVTRLTLQWDVTSGSTESEVAVLEQEVVVIAKLLEARRSFGNLFGLRLSPSKTSLNQQQAASPRSSLGGGTPRRTSQVWDPQCDTVPEADQGPAEANQAPWRVTFDPTAGSSPAGPSDPSSQLPPRPPQTSTGQRGELTAGFGGAASGAGDNNDEDEESQESARQDFLRILSALATASSVDSEVGIIAAASPAQLAAAASLPRAPSVKDLATFAAAAGLPLQTVTQAAASSRLSFGGTSSDVGSSRASSARSLGARVRGDRSGSNNSRNNGGSRAEGSTHEKVQLAPVPVATATSPADATSGLLGAQPRVLSELTAAAPAGAGTAATAAAIAAAAAAAASLSSSGAAAPQATVPSADEVTGEQLSAPVVSVTPAASPSLNPAEVGVPSTTNAARLAPSNWGPAAAAERMRQQHTESVPGGVSSTAMVTSSPTGSSGWEPQQLAVVTLSSAGPADTPHHPQPPIQSQSLSQIRTQLESQSARERQPESQPALQAPDGGVGPGLEAAAGSSESTAAWVQATLTPRSNTKQAEAAAAAAAAAAAVAVAATPSPGDVSWGHPDAAAGAAGVGGDSHSSTAATAGTSERTTGTSERRSSNSYSNTSNFQGSTSSTTSHAPNIAAGVGSGDGVRRNSSSSVGSRDQLGVADGEGLQPTPEVAVTSSLAAVPPVRTGLQGRQGGNTCRSSTGSVEPMLKKQGSPLQDLSDRYNILLGGRSQPQQPQHTQHARQVLEELEEPLSPQQILSVMPGLAAAGSTADTEPLLSQGFRTSSQSSMMIRTTHSAADTQDSSSMVRAAQGSGDTGLMGTGLGGDVAGPATATAGPKSGPTPSPAAPAGPEEAKAVGSAAAGAADWENVVPPWPGGYGDTPPPPPSPRLLAAAAATDLVTASAAFGTAPAAGTSDVSEMLAYPAYSTATAANTAAPTTTTTIGGTSGSSSAPAAELAAPAAPFMAPLNLQQQKSAVPTASGAAYPDITAPGNSVDSTASIPAGATATTATGTSSRLSAVLAVKQPAGNTAALGTTATGSSSSSRVPLLASSTHDLFSSSVPESAATSTVVSLLAAAIAAVLAAAATVLPPLLAALTAAAVGMSVFLLRQATWLFHVGWRVGLRMLLWVALAGPRAGAWLTRQAWEALAPAAQMATRISTTSTTSMTGSLSVPMVTAGSIVPQGSVQFSSMRPAAAPGLLQGSTTAKHATPAAAAVATAGQRVSALPHLTRPISRVSKPSAIWPFGQATSSLMVASTAPPATHTATAHSASSSPAAADIAAARTTLSGPGANSSRLPPSLGAPASTVWAPSAGRSTAASLAAAAMAPVALLLQWPVNTATVLFEVLVWGVSIMLGAPLAVGLGLLRYLSLLPTRQVGPPELSSVAAAGGLAAQGEIMPGADAAAVAAGLVGLTAREGAATAAARAGAAGERVVSEVPGSLSSSSVPLSSTVVPEEHEVSGQELLRAESVTTRPRSVAFAPEPLTPAPSMEVPGSVAGRSWSMSLLTAALSRLGSASLTATPASAVSASPKAADNARARGFSTAASTVITRYSANAGGVDTLPSGSGSVTEAAAGSGSARGLSRFSVSTTAAPLTAAPAGDSQPAASTSSSRSSSASVSRSSSSSSIDNGFGSSWAFGRRRLRPLTDAAAAAKAILLKGRLGMRPLAASSATGVTGAGSVGAVPSVVPPSGNAAGSVIQQVNSSIDSFTGRGGWWPAWASWYPNRGATPLLAPATTAALTSAGAAGGGYTSGHVVPSTPPSTPTVASSFSRPGSITSNGVGPSRLLAASHPAPPSHTTLSRFSWPLAYVRPGGPADSATSSAAAPAVSTWSWFPASSGSFTRGHLASLSVGNILRGAAAAAEFVWAMFVLLVVGPVLWLWAAWVQLGVVTAAWLAGAFVWWAVLPVRLAWWGLVLVGKVGPGAWEGVKWVAEMVAVPHDDRSDVYTGPAAVVHATMQAS